MGFVTIGFVRMPRLENEAPKNRSPSRRLDQGHPWAVESEERSVDSQWGSFWTPGWPSRIWGWWMWCFLEKTGVWATAGVFLFMHPPKMCERAIAIAIEQVGRTLLQKKDGKRHQIRLDGPSDAAFKCPGAYGLAQTSLALTKEITGLVYFSLKQRNCSGCITFSSYSSMS